MDEPRNTGGWWATEPLIKFESPCRIALVGQSQSGKTTYFKKLIDSCGVTFTRKSEKVFIAFSSWQPLYTELESKYGDFIELHEGLPDSETLLNLGSCTHIV